MHHDEANERTARLAQVLEILKRDAPPEERELVLQVAPILFAGMPPRIGLGMPPEVVATRILKLHYPYIAREMPPAHQLYKGLPGIHVTATNPSEAESRAIGGGQGLPLETTILRTHTPDRPFIFDSLKNYLQKSGLRVYAAFHPIFVVHRQWERVVGFGDVHDEGSKESYCLFHLEPIHEKERLRRIEHEVFSLLKAVFLAVDDFKDMGRVCRELVPRLRSKRGDEAELKSARAFLEWLQDDNYIFMGTVSYGAAKDGTLARLDETATGVFTDPTLLPVVFPGVMEHVETHLGPDPLHQQILEFDFCANASAIYHMEPIEDLTVREWGEDGSLKGLTVLLGPLRARGLRAARRPHPAAQGEARPHPGGVGCHPGLAHLARDARHLQQLPQDRSLLRQGERPRARDPRHRGGVGRRGDRGREPPGGRLRGALRGLLAPALLLPDRGGAAPRVRRRLRAGRVRHLGRLRAGDAPDLLLQLERARAPGRPGRGAAADRAAGDVVGGPRLGRARRRVRRERGPAPVPALRHAGVEERPLPRGDRARAGAARPAPVRGAREPARDRDQREGRRAGLGAAVLGALARPDRHPEDDAEPRADGHRGAAHPAHAAERSPLPALPLRDRGAGGADRLAARGRAAPGRRAARARRGARDRRPAERADPLGGAELARRRAAAHAAQPPAADPQPLERRDRERRAGAQQRGGGRALSRLRVALRPGPAGRSRSGDRRGGRRLHALARRRAQPGRGRGAARLRQPGELGAAHERLPAAGAAGVLDQGRLQEDRGDAVAAADVRDLRALAAPRGHPPARGQGRPRRDPLVRPPRRLPHRDPGADEDPDGQERGDRAGRLEGRLRAEGRGARAVPRSTST